MHIHARTHPLTLQAHTSLKQLTFSQIIQFLLLLTLVAAYKVKNGTKFLPEAEAIFIMNPFFLASMPGRMRAVICIKCAHIS